MNNIVKSVVFAAVVLFAGIAAMQVIYKNQDATSDITSVEPAAGEAAVMMDGQPTDTQTQTISDTTAPVLTEDQADAAKDAVDANADAAKDAIEEQKDATQEAVENAEDADAVTGDQADAAKDAAEADADAAKDAVDAQADADKEAIEEKTAE